MPNESILVVDDNPKNVKLVAFILGAKGYRIRTAGAADEALAVLEHEVPALILMDLQLPGMDGLTLTSMLKRDPRTKDTIIVAFTAYAMKGDEDRAREAGCDGYITKPVDTRSLPTQIAQYLADGRARKKEPQSCPQ